MERSTQIVGYQLDGNLTSVEPGSSRLPDPGERLGRRPLETTFGFQLVIVHVIGAKYGFPYLDERVSRHFWWTRSTSTLQADTETGLEPPKWGLHIQASNERHVLGLPLIMIDKAE